MSHRFALLGSLALIVGCGGGGPAPNCGCTSPASLTVSLVGGTTGEGLQSLRVEVTKVEARAGAAWQPLSTQSVAFEALGGGEASAAMSAPGTASFDALRLTFGPNTQARLADGSTVALGLPQGGVEVPLDAPTAPGASTSLVVVLDPGLSVHRREAGYVFLPELRALDRSGAGRFTGRVTGGDGQPLAGAVVSAQALPSLGEPRLLRRTITGADGHYTLDFLPGGNPTYAVTWIAGAAGSYAPKASAAYTPSPTWPVATADFQLAAHADTAALRGAHLPALPAGTAGTTFLLFGPIVAGGEPQLFYVGAVPTSVQGGVERYAFPALPQGSTYQVRGRRRAWDAQGHPTDSWRFSTDLGLVAGIDATVDVLW